MKSWVDKQEWDGQLRKPALFHRIGKIEQRRIYWGLWFKRIFRAPWIWERAILTDPVTRKCRRIRAKMLAEAYGHPVPTDKELFLTASSQWPAFDPRSPYPVCRYLDEMWKSDVLSSCNKTV